MLTIAVAVAPVVFAFCVGLALGYWWQRRPQTKTQTETILAATVAKLETQNIDLINRLQRATRSIDLDGKSTALKERLDLAGATIVDMTAGKNMAVETSKQLHAKFDDADRSFRLQRVNFERVRNDLVRQRNQLLLERDRLRETVEVYEHGVPTPGVLLKSRRDLESSIDEISEKKRLAEAELDTLKEALGAAERYLDEPSRGAEAKAVVENIRILRASAPG